VYFTLDLELTGFSFLRFGEKGAVGFVLFVFRRGVGFVGRGGFVIIVIGVDVVDFAVSPQVFAFG
jgi:hypothetical protein